MAFGTVNPRRPGIRPFPTLRGIVCQRCLLRMQEYPDHTCCFARGYTSCQHCIGVRHRCDPIPEEIMPCAEEAIKLRGEERQAKIREIRQMIKMRTRAINAEAKLQAAAEEQLQQSLRESLGESNTGKNENSKKLDNTGWCTIL